MSDSFRETDGFLSRWSRLKSQPTDVAESLSNHSLDVDADLGGVESQSLEHDTGLQVELDTAAGAYPETEPETEALTDADMPDIDSLDEQSDFSGFLSEKVSEHLRRKALQKLFHLPEFNVRDGLNEYDEDYSKFIPLGDTVTYQMKQFIERQKQDFKDALEDDGQAGLESNSVDAEDRHPVRESSAVTCEPVVAVDQTLGQEQQRDNQEEDDLGACE